LHVAGATGKSSAGAGATAMGPTAGGVWLVCDGSA